MKFLPGTCLSLKSNNSFFAGIITISDNDRYEIVLTRFRDTSPPTPDAFINAELLSAKMAMGDQSILSLDVIILNPFYADAEDDITIIHHLNIPPFSTAEGFHPIEDLSEISNYYDHAIGLRNGTIPPDPKDPMTMFTEKTFVTANDFFQQQPAANLFPVVKLYRKTGDATDYLQLYGNSEEPAYLVLHWGRVGEKSLLHHIKDKTLQELQQQYADYFDAQTAAGYRPADNAHSLILQFGTGNSWGGLDDLDFRNEIWNELEAWLFWSGNGDVSGGDIGSGTVNLFLDVIDLEMAVQAIKAMLAKKQISRPFIVARQNDEEVNVIYPTNYEGEFFF